MKSIMILMMVTTELFCSGQSSTDSVYTGTLDSTKNVQSQKPLTNHNENNFYTKYEYTESNNARLIIQNSFPKSGINYTDPNGKKYIYAVFWTQITNETLNPIELTIDFPLDSFEIPSSSGNYMKLILPSDPMTIDKEPLYDYGLTIKSFLDNNRHKSSSLKRTIKPKRSTAFYVVTLSNHGSGGALRTGLSLKGQNLFYKISVYNNSTTELPVMDEKEIKCGKINLKNLKKYKDSLAQASLLKAELSKAIEDGTIYNSTSPHHNVLHEFTYLMAMRDYCNKTLLQMRANGEVNKKLSKELERQVLNAKPELTSSKFNGLKIESGLYEVFLKQINDRFRD